MDWTNYIGKVNCMDCLDLMKLMPDKCVDLVLTDPPYNTTQLDFESGIFTDIKFLNELARITRGGL